MPKLIVGLVAVAIGMSVLPFFLEVYQTEIIIMLFIGILMAVSYRFVLLMGEWSICHGPMMGIGAYTAALLSKELGFSFWATLPLAGLTAALVALILSYPLLKMRAFSFFIGSLAAGEAIRLVWVNFRYPFGGTYGLSGIPPPPPISIPGLTTISFGGTPGTTPYYFLTMAIVAVCLVVMYRLERSRIGDTIKAISMQYPLAGSVGINVQKYRTMAFVIGSSFAGIAGVLLTHRLSAIDPRLFGFAYSLYVLVWVVVGGAMTFAGPIIGVCFLTGIGEATRALEAWRPLLYGFILIMTLLFLPGGLESLPGKIRPLAERLRSRLRGE